MHTYADGTRALAGITLDIRAGEYVAIIGQNGAGKTTLVRNFLGLLEPSAGPWSSMDAGCRNSP